MEQQENGNSSDTRIRNNPQTYPTECLSPSNGNWRRPHKSVFWARVIRTHGLLGYEVWCQKSKSWLDGRHSRRGKKVKQWVLLTYDVAPRIVKKNDGIANQFFDEYSRLSKGNKVTTDGKEKILWPSKDLKPISGEKPVRSALTISLISETLLEATMVPIETSRTA